MQEELEESYERLSNVEELKENLSFSLHKLQEEEIGIISNLKEIRSKFGQLENFGQIYKELNQRFQSVLLELDDMRMEMENLAENIEDDPQALESVNAELQNLYNLQKKHQVDSVEALLEIQSKLEEEISASENAEANTDQLQKQIDKAYQEAQQQADQLLKSRKKIIPDFIKSIQDILSKLGRSEEHTSELQSRSHLVCRLLL